MNLREWRKLKATMSAIEDALDSDSGTSEADSDEVGSTEDDDGSDDSDSDDSWILDTHPRVTFWRFGSITYPWLTCDEVLASQLRGRPHPGRYNGPIPELRWEHVLRVLTHVGLQNVEDITEKWSLANSTMKTLGVSFGKRMLLRMLSQTRQSEHPVGSAAPEP